jgi:hypothetical protein
LDLLSRLCLGICGGFNTYAYVGGNPISANDPSGLAPWAIGAVVGACWAGYKFSEAVRSSTDANNTLTQMRDANELWRSRMVGQPPFSASEVDKARADSQRSLGELFREGVITSVGSVVSAGRSGLSVLDTTLSNVISAGAGYGAAVYKYITKP